MPRMRTLKPEAASSESLAEVPRATRWTFSMFWTHCDDEGRAVWNLRLIKAAIYPLDDDVTPGTLADEFADLERIGAVCRYVVDGKEYIHVPAFGEHQHPNRKVDSKLPPCPRTSHGGSTHAQRSEDARTAHEALTPVVVVVDVDVDGAHSAEPPRKRGTRIPEDWKPPPTEVGWRRENGISDLVARRELPKFVDYWTAKPGREAVKLDWLATWRNWLRNAQEREPANRHGPPGERPQDLLAALSKGNRP